MLRLLKKARERINIFLYDSEANVLRALRIFVFISAIVSFGSFIVFYGFDLPQQQSADIFLLIKFSLSVFIINYLAQLAYSNSRAQFLRSTKIEALLVLLLLYDGISLYFFQFPLLQGFFQWIGIKNYVPFYILSVTLYVVVFASLELLRVSSNFLKVKLSAIWLFILCILAGIATGTALLILPEASTNQGSLNIGEALFTATSAFTLTGLKVIVPATQLSVKGHVILLFLIQSGGLLIISFTSFFAFFVKRGIEIGHHTHLMDFMGEGARFDFSKLFKDILIYVGAIELIGAVSIFMLLPHEIQFESIGDKIFFSVFHAVSGFCNSGHTLLEGGFRNSLLQHTYILHLIFIFLIVMGALGFPALKDLFGLRNLRDRMAKPWKQWKTSTQIAILGAILLGLVSGVLISLLEFEGQYKGLGLISAITEGIFLAVNRTAGFSTIDLASIAPATSILLIFLMFIGGSSGSLTGGLKTSTFTIIMLSVISTIKGKKDIEFSRRSISFNLLRRAYSIFIFSFFYIMLVIFALTIIESNIHIRYLAFEVVSAFSLSGLSSGITPVLSNTAQLILVVTMFIGRIGTIAFAFSISTTKDNEVFDYPEAKIMIG